MASIVNIERSVAKGTFWICISDVGYDSPSVSLLGERLRDANLLSSTSSRRPASGCLSRSVGGGRADQLTLNTDH